MHETHLIRNIFRYLEGEEQRSSRRIKNVHVSISEFSGLTGEHFREHYKEASRGTRWGSVALEIRKVPYGPELEITKIDFE